MQRTDRSFLQDDRAIEGLPIRLVIAIVVGVAALAIMMSILGGISGFGDTEVTVEIEDGETVDMSADDNVTFSVVDEDGEDVEGATVLFEPGTARGDIHEVSMDDGNATVTIEDFTDAVNAELASDQSRGTYEIEILPPSDSDYVDEQSNPEIVVLAN